MSSWAASAETRILHLEHELTRIEEKKYKVTPIRVGQARTTLEQARHLLRPWPYFLGVVGGSGPERVWGRIHEVETLLDEVDGQTFELHERAEEHARAELPRELAKWEREYIIAGPVEKDTKARHMIQRAHEAAASKWATQRNQQRGILFVSLLLTALAIVALLLQSWSGSAFLPSPSGSQADATQTLVLAMTFGALGGLLSGFIALYLGQTTLEDSRWLDVKPALIFAKAATGLWTAVIGAAAVSTEVLVGNYTSTAALILLSVAFGYSQQAVTAFLDRRAAALLEDEPAKTSPPTTNVTVAPHAGTRE